MDGDPDAWRRLAERAVTLCRQAVDAPSGARAAPRIAGSMAPLEDCYRPDLTPDDATLAREHGDLARVLAAAGVDLLLVETMPTRRELAAATRAAASTGLEVWSAVTLGPRGDFFPPAALRGAAADARAAGADVFLVNCSAPDATTRALQQLAEHADRPARLGAYANTLFDGEAAWTVDRYLDEAERWLSLGARVVGGCCGTGREHLAALRRLADTWSVP